MSTTHGNAPTKYTTPNTASILAALGRYDVNVYPGVETPYCRDEAPPVEIHGPTGLGGTTYLPEAQAPIRRDINAIVAARDAIMAQPFQTAWYVATGPTTNAALLFAVFPEVAHHLAGLSIMGGAVGDGFTKGPQFKTLDEDTNGTSARIGNETQWAEFNVYCDPESLNSIMRNPVLANKTVLITLDLTHQCLAVPEVRKSLLYGPDPSKSPSNLRLLLNEILEFFATSYDEFFDVKEGPPLHDPLAVAAIFGYQDSMIYDDVEKERFDITVVTDGQHSPEDSIRGQVGRTILTKSETGQGVRVPRKLNVNAFWKVLEECCAKADRDQAAM